MVNKEIHWKVLNGGFCINKSIINQDQDDQVLIFKTVNK